MLTASVKYLVFAGMNYYPGSGVNDLIAIFNDLTLAEKTAVLALKGQGGKNNWSHVVRINSDETYQMIVKFWTEGESGSKLCMERTNENEVDG